MNSVPPTETEQTEEFSVPVNWRHSRRHKERVVLAGVGPPEAKLMFITSSVLDEDTIEQELGAVSGISFKRAPALLKGAHGVALRDMCVSVGISMPVDVYFTALCKWLLPKDKNLAPKLKDGEPGFACLEREICEIKPEIVVVFGKAAFEFMVSKRLKFGDALGAWFWSDKFQCRVMPMNHYYYIAAKPEWTDRFRMDFAQVKLELDALRGVRVEKLPLTMTVIKTAAQLQAWVDSVQDYNLWSIDCEWHGKNHVDGELRSLQICWRSDQAIYIRFRDAERKYVFDVSYEEVGKILAKKWNSSALKLVGHHISADLPWTSHLLKLEWFGKCVLDSEFAFQCVNEHADLGLERMSVRFTDLGRYEMDLEEWKRSNSALVADGYGHIPDDILIPYACKDVVVVFRAAPIIWKLLDQQQMVPYYRDIMNPFVTDVFTSFALTGLPMNYALIDEMRDVYEFARLETEKDFRDLLKKEAWQLLAERFVDHLPPAWHEPAARKMMVSIWEKRMPSEWEMLPNTAAFLSNAAMASASMGGASVMSDRFKVTLEHAITAASFNLRSTPHMKKWLFQVKGYTPVKSTANKPKGIPAMDWSKVMTWPPHRREGIEPAVDKQTLKILASMHSDVLLEKLLELNAVGNICKAFLKQPERDEEGNVVAEAGLPAWIASDGRTHGQTSMTETGRPRSWNPNSLNWPSYLQDKVKTGIEKALRKANEENRLPDRFDKYRTGTPVLPLRSVVQAPPGFVVVESDYQTAEVRGLAFISGDENLIRIMTRPDSQFGLSVNPMTGKKETVRLNYAEDCGIPPHNQNPDFIMRVWVEGKFIRKVADSDLVRDKHGNIVNSKVDLHWSLAEMFKEVPREMLTEDEDRKAGKAGNFKTAYGSTPGTLERSIESDTGKKPEQGTGQKILDALQRRQPVAVEFLNSVEKAPHDPGYLRAASGKVRHFVKPPSGTGLNDRLRKSILSAQGREARNFFMQESVAATAMRAAYHLLCFARKFNLVGRPITVLYDSVVTLCPLHERFIWTKAHEICMYLANGWMYHGRVLRYPIDNKFNTGWGLAPKLDSRCKAWHDKIPEKDFAGTPENLKPLEKWLDDVSEFYRKNENASLVFTGLA